MYHDFCKKKQENVVKGFIVIEVIQSQENLARNYLYLLPKWILKKKFET
jgi:hypothetical protein